MTESALLKHDINHDHALTKQISEDMVKEASRFGAALPPQGLESFQSLRDDEYKNALRTVAGECEGSSLSPS